ncbi:MAG: hypothetical protein ACLP0J_16000 [Solirubrobacteraceae bacterium]
MREDLTGDGGRRVSAETTLPDGQDDHDSVNNAGVMLLGPFCAELSLERRQRSQRPGASAADRAL